MGDAGFYAKVATAVRELPTGFKRHFEADRDVHVTLGNGHLKRFLPVTFEIAEDWPRFRDLDGPAEFRLKNECDVCRGAQVPFGLLLGAEASAQRSFDRVC